MTTNTTQAQIIELMQQFQYTATETRLYISLLEDSPATGYELAARSGVPRSAIYNTLKKLKSRGLVNIVQENPVRYAPLPPDQLCDRLNQHYQQSIAALKQGFESMPHNSSAATLWQVHGFDNVIQEAIQHINLATRSIHVGLWQREANELVTTLDAAANKGLDVQIFGFTHLPDCVANVYSCHIDETELEAYWPHRLLLIVDREIVLVGELNQIEQAYAVITKEPAIVSMGANNLILDLTLFGQRFGVDVSSATAGLQSHLAPIDTLIEEGTLV